MADQAVQAGERELLLALHERIESHYDLDRWHWREDTPATDICLGAILVQHTAWTNVETALERLRVADARSLQAVASLPEEELAALVRSAGTPLTKARRLRAFAQSVLAAGGLEALAALTPDEARRFLLAVPGIGPETADVICLYALRQPVVVNDAYTQRFLGRAGLGPAGSRYETWRAWLDGALPAAGDLRRRHHAGIVVHCKTTCRARPRCHVCPVAALCAHAKAKMV